MPRAGFDTGLWSLSPGGLLQTSAGQSLRVHPRRRSPSISPKPIDSASKSCYEEGGFGRWK